MLRAVLEVVKELVKAWHAQHLPHGVKWNVLVNSVYTAAWRRKLDENLGEQLYKPHPVRYSAEEEEKDEETEDLKPGETSIDVIRKAAIKSEAASSSQNEDRGVDTRDGDPHPVVDPEERCETHMDKVAKSHSDRWVEEAAARDMLDKMTWADYCPHDLRHELYKVFEMGMKYVDEFDNSVVNQWSTQGVPTHVRVWVAELEWTFNAMMAKGWLPQDCRCPHDKFIRLRATGGQGDKDPGNQDYDVVVNLLRIWRAVDVHHYEQVVKVAAAAYGENGNKSSHGPVNLRGNIVESVLRHCQAAGAHPRHTRGWQIRSCQETFLGWYDIETDEGAT